MSQRKNFGFQALPLVIVLSLLTACSSPPGTPQSSTPASSTASSTAASTASSTVPDKVVESMLGEWEFGRTNGTFLCKLTLTKEKGPNNTMVIRACNPNESFWKMVSEKQMHFMSINGDVTTRFYQKSPVSWEGPYKDGQIIHYLRRKDASSSGTPDKSKAESQGSQEKAKKQ